jgi:hypothetical protein
MKKRLLLLVFGIQLFAAVNSFADAMPWPQCFPCRLAADQVHSGR